MSNDSLLLAIGLKPKVYITTSVQQTVKKAKGVNRNVVKNQMTADDYYQTLKTNQTKYFLQKSFVSRKQRLYLESFKKASLSTLDFKRFWLPDGVQSVPFFMPSPFHPPLLSLPFSSIEKTLDQIRSLRSLQHVDETVSLEAIDEVVEESSRNFRRRFPSAIDGATELSMCVSKKPRSAENDRVKAAIVSKNSDKNSL